MISKEKELEIVKYLVNKELKKHKKKFEDVVGLQNEGWYLKYTWTQKEEDKFVRESIAWLRKNHKLSLKTATRFINEFLLMWGLKVVED